MMTSLKRWAATATILSTLALGATPAFAGPDQQADVDHAIGTLQDLRHDKAFGNARQLLQTARAVLIAPRIFKAGFFFGGQGGNDDGDGDGGGSRRALGSGFDVLVGLKKSLDPAGILNPGRLYAGL